MLNENKKMEEFIETFLSSLPETMEKIKSINSKENPKDSDIFTVYKVLEKMVDVLLITLNDKIISIFALRKLNIYHSNHNNLIEYNTSKFNIELYLKYFDMNEVNNMLYNFYNYDGITPNDIKSYIKTKLVFNDKISNNYRLLSFDNINNDIISFVIEDDDKNQKKMSFNINDFDKSIDELKKIFDADIDSIVEFVYNYFLKHDLNYIRYIKFIDIKYEGYDIQLINSMKDYSCYQIINKYLDFNKISREVEL